MGSETGQLLVVSDVSYPQVSRATGEARGSGLREVVEQDSESKQDSHWCSQLRQSNPQPAAWGNVRLVTAPLKLNVIKEQGQDLSVRERASCCEMDSP
ncbi:unnamed protein product [Arctogadus glacialis]